MIYGLLLTCTGFVGGLWALALASRSIPGPGLSGTRAVRDALDWYEARRLARHERSARRAEAWQIHHEAGMEQ